MRLPACPIGEGNPLTVVAPSSIMARRKAVIRIAAPLSERLSLSLVGPRGVVRLARSTSADELRVTTGRLSSGVYRLRSAAAFTYPVPETGELGLCERAVRRAIRVRSAS